MTFFASILALTGITLVVFLLLALLVLLFEIWMFVAAIQNKAISNDRRILWLIGMLLIHPFVAIAYYFTDHQKQLS